MKNIVLIIAVLLGVIVFMPTASYAADPFQKLCTDTPNAEVCKGRSEQQNTATNAIYGRNGIITRVTQLISMAAGVAAVIMIIIGGLQYVLSAGDPAKAAKSKNTIMFAVVGIVIAVSAQAIVIFVLSKL